LPARTSTRRRSRPYTGIVAGVAVATCLVLAGCGGSDEASQPPVAPRQGSDAPDPPPSATEPSATAWSPRRAAELAACFEPAYGYGFEEGECARLERVERVREGVWRLQLRRPPLYCVELARLEGRPDDLQRDFDGVGRLTEVRCPASAYPREPRPDVQAPLRNYETGALSARPGSVSLTAVGPEQTRVLVEADVDTAWIAAGRCGSQSTGQRFQLEEFYSFRSVTLLRVPLRTLTATPHALYVDAGGGHGGTPIACADLSESR
jgi:hypothetical protein